MANNDWIDVEDSTGVITVDYGQAGKDIANAPRRASEAIQGSFNDNVAIPVQEAAQSVARPFNEFSDTVGKEGVGEAVWQTVAEPMSNIPGAARGAIVGAGAALAKDVIDPTPGINPMGIAGGGAVGAVAGAALPYAVDAVQAMSNPNSLLRGETYGKALEGVGIASGITGEVRPEIKEMVPPGFGEEFTERGLNIAGNVGEGIGNAYQGALAGSNQLGSDVAGFFGFDDISEMYQVLADNRREAMEPNSAVGAVSKELAYDAGMGGVLGKVYDTAKAGGKVVSKWQGKNVINRGKSAINDLLGIAKDTAKAQPRVVPKTLDMNAIRKASKDSVSNQQKLVDKLFDQSKKDTSMFPGAQAVADLAGTFSPKSKKFIEDVWDTGAAYVFGSKNASLRAYDKMANEAKKAGFSNKEADEILKWMSDNPKYFEPLKDLVTKPGVNTNTAKLFGTGTAITADVDD